jgi:predicted phage gp36 major capsid-like protein
MVNNGTQGTARVPALEFIPPEETPTDCGNVVPRHTLGNATGAATAISPVQSPCHTTDANCDDADYMVAEDSAMVDVTGLHPGNGAQSLVTGETPLNTLSGLLHLHSAPIWSCK